MATLGVRVDHHEIFHNETSPRAYLVWQATPELTIKGVSNGEDGKPLPAVCVDLVDDDVVSRRGGRGRDGDGR